MSYCSNLDIFSWVQNLPPPNSWATPTMSTTIYSPPSNPPQPSLNLSASTDPQSQSQSLLFSIVADFNFPISLWASKPLKPELSSKTVSNLLKNLVRDVLNYGSPRASSFALRFPKIDASLENLQEAFNLAFYTLTFLVCVYEAPRDLRGGCIRTLKSCIAECRSRNGSKLLVKLLGSNMEEQWMRSVNLAITNWIVEVKTVVKTPSPLFSYALSTYGLWKVQMYCPVIAMDVESSSSILADERLGFSLNYHQLEGVVQFNYQVRVREKWVDLVVSIDNIRCDVIRLISETLLRQRGSGSAEKHFPSRICVQLTPTLQTNVLSVSVGKSSENPTREIGFEKSIEGSFDPPTAFPGLSITASETSTVSLKPWKFEQSVNGYSANMNWFLHDSTDGREVFSSKPSKFSLLRPKAWFKNRYSSVHRPFTRQGGVVFAGDEYGESVWWKMDKGAIGKAMEWEMRGWIWVTYWPNKHRTFHTETRRLEFRETLDVTIA